MSEAQADRVTKALEGDSDLYNTLLTVNKFMADTVHKFQSDERDMMFFSTVISDGSPTSCVNFLKSTGNLFNVAITRAKSSLVVVGNQEYCKGCGVSYLEHFVEYVMRQESRLSLSIRLITIAWISPCSITVSASISRWMEKGTIAVGIVSFATGTSSEIRECSSWDGMFGDSGYMNFETECHGVSSRSSHGWSNRISFFISVENRISAAECTRSPLFSIVAFR